MNHQGVPLRLELGPIDIQKSQTISVRRDTGVKAPIPLSELSTAIPSLLETIQREMYERAKALYMSRLRVVTNWDDLVPTLDSKCVAVLPWCEEEACEDDIKERSARECVSISPCPFLANEEI